MICIDSDVFLIDLRYPTDRRASETRAFLDRIAASGKGTTTVFNLLEIAGVLSFNLNPQQLLELYIHFPARYHVRVLPSGDLRAPLPGVRTAEVFQVIQRKAALGDALIAALVNRLQQEITAFVTWNEHHFRGRITVPIFTPSTFPTRH